MDVFLGLVQAGRPLFVCEGSHEERKTAFSALQANQRKGCVLDGITLSIAQALGIERALPAVCGPIAIVEATLLNIQSKIHELEARIDQSELSLVWRGGQIYRNEVTPAEKRDTLELLLKRKLWITNECEILPARGTNDLSLNLRELTQRFGGSFIDELRASEESGRLFVSEDRVLRELGMAEFGLRTSWLQPILMRASSMNLISRDEYSASALCFIQSNVQFVSIDAQFLVWSLGGTKEHSLPQDFLSVAERLGGLNAHLNSHLSVAFNVIGATWHDVGLSSTLRLAVVSCMLDNLTKERPLNDVAVLLHAFREFGRFQLRDRRFLQHLGAWQRGHFIFFHGAAG